MKDCLEAADTLAPGTQTIGLAANGVILGFSLVFAWDAIGKAKLVDIFC